MKIIYLLLIYFISLPTNVWALTEEEEDLIHYDQIITELNRSKVKKRAFKDSDPFDSVLIHAGVGFISSNISILPENSEGFSSFLNGVEASIGIDLFSENWAAEGAVRSFGEQRNKVGEYSLKEFDLRILYRDVMSYRLKWRAGIGMAARYLNYAALNTVSDLSVPIPQEKFMKYTTPASIVFFGIEGYLNKTISLGAEVSYRSSLIDETADKRTLEASLKLDTHF